VLSGRKGMKRREFLALREFFFTLKEYALLSSIRKD
jgi:hypothetical protein